MRILICDVCSKEGKTTEAYYVRVIVGKYIPKTKKWNYYNSKTIKLHLCNEHLKIFADILSNKIDEIIDILSK
jgi:hypothetical protein